MLDKSSQAEKLGITEAELQALLDVRDDLESGKISHARLRGESVHRSGEWYWLRPETAKALVVREADRWAINWHPDRQFGFHEGTAQWK